MDWSAAELFDFFGPVAACSSWESEVKRGFPEREMRAGRAMSSCQLSCIVRQLGQPIFLSRRSRFLRSHFASVLLNAVVGMLITKLDGRAHVPSSRKVAISVVRFHCGSSNVLAAGLVRLAQPARSRP